MSVLDENITDVTDKIAGRSVLTISTDDDVYNIPALLQAWYTVLYECYSHGDIRRLINALDLYRWTHIPYKYSITETGWDDGRIRISIKPLPEAKLEYYRELILMWMQHFEFNGCEYSYFFDCVKAVFDIHTDWGTNRIPLNYDKDYRVVVRDEKTGTLNASDKYETIKTKYQLYIDTINFLLNE